MYRTLQETCDEGAPCSPGQGSGALIGSLRIQALPTNHEKTRTCSCTCSCYEILCCNMPSDKNILRKWACVHQRFEEHCAGGPRVTRRVRRLLCRHSAAKTLSLVGHATPSLLHTWGLWHPQRVRLCAGLIPTGCVSPTTVHSRRPMCCVTRVARDWSDLANAESKRPMCQAALNMWLSVAVFTIAIAHRIAM